MNFRNLTQRSDFDLSMVLLTTVVLFALGGLALDANWTKLLRVSLSFATYGTVLLTSPGGSVAPSMSRFVLAGAAAGLVSGLVRPEAMPLLLIAAQTLGAAALLGPAHWLSLRSYRRIHSRIAEPWNSGSSGKARHQ